jgi:hypothetical protein
MGVDWEGYRYDWGRLQEARKGVEVDLQIDSIGFFYFQNFISRNYLNSCLLDILQLLRTFFAPPCRHPDCLSYMHPHFLLIILQLLFKSIILMLDIRSDLAVYFFHSKDFCHFAILERILNLKRVLRTKREVFLFNIPGTCKHF